MSGAHGRFSAGSSSAGRVLWVTLAVLAGLALAGCGGGSKSGSSSTTTTTQNGCVVVSAPPAFPPKKQSKPTEVLDPNAIYTVTMVTNCGTFAFRIDQKQSPHASASFVTLVQRGFFNSTVFHRIVPGFVIQGGDPTGTGAGGPGYTTVDKPPANAAYTLGTVAMAKTAAQPAGTAGSQFFIVTAKNAGLGPAYAIIGKVVSGLPVVERIGKLGNASQQPTMVVEIDHATVSKTRATHPK
jgi:peptidyl-prolyl cis-trans isomerase B (cyclophilin B)